MEDYGGYTGRYLDLGLHLISCRKDFLEKR